MNKLLALVALISYGATCFQLLCYRRGRANFHIHISVVAWLLIVFTGTGAIEILLGHAVSIGQAGIATTICMLIWRAQGNVANLVRGNW